MLTRSISAASNVKVNSAALAALRVNEVVNISNTGGGLVVCAILTRLSRDGWIKEDGDVGEVLWKYLTRGGGLEEVILDICKIDGALEYLYDFILERGSIDAGGGFGEVVAALNTLSWDDTSLVDVTILQKFSSRAALERRKAASPKKAEGGDREEDGEEEEEEDDDEEL